MRIDQEVKTGTQALDEQLFQEIDAFLTKKRRAVICTLAEKECLSQGELATAIGSTVTSLSNIIQRFDSFKHSLLEVERVGRYRRYSLSPLGRAYATMKDIASEAAGQAVDDEEQRLFQIAQESLEKFKEKNSDEDWETNFEEALLRRVRSGVFLDDASEALVDRYLHCLELLTMRGGYDTLEQALSLLTNPIHRTRIAAFMERFEPFSAVLRSIQNGAEPFDMCMILQSALSEQEADTVWEYLKAVGWKREDYDKLKKAVPALKRSVSEYRQRDIYQYFTCLLPDQKFLCSNIAQWLDKS